MKILGIVVKIVGGTLLALVLLAGVLLAAISFSQFVPRNYVKTTATGGRLEANYLAMGGCRVSRHKAKAEEEAFKEYVVYYPSELSGNEKTYPVVIFVNGTGVLASKYKTLFQHLASWGFIVAGNEDGGSWDGRSSDQTLDYILRQNEDPDSLFYQKIDVDRIGISGHSQGGAGVFNAITERSRSPLYKTAVALSPTHEAGAAALGWHYDLEQVNIPLFLMAGTQGEFETELVIPLESMEEMYEKLGADKVMARKTGCEHGQTLYAADGYVTAWFMWQLQGDQEAAAAFTGPEPELLSNPLYQNQRAALS